MTALVVLSIRPFRSVAYQAGSPAMHRLFVPAMLMLATIAIPARAQQPATQPGTVVISAETLPSGDSDRLRRSLMVWDRSRADRPLISERARLERPLARGLMTSAFGYRFDPINHIGRAHRGLDIASPLGTPVMASAAGTVVFAGFAGGYGLMVEIDHGGGIRTRYGHLSKLLVWSGQSVFGGQTIGQVGSTGHSTGSHLHFEVRVNGIASDPSRSLPYVVSTGRPDEPEPGQVVRHWPGWSQTTDRLPSAF